MRAVIARHQEIPFGWGVSDCSLFAEVVHAMTGYDPLAGIEPYTSAFTALKALRRLGYPSVLELVEAKFPEIAPAHASRGDLGFPAATDPLASPAVIDGPIAHSKNEVGSVAIPRGHIVRAFAV